MVGGRGMSGGSDTLSRIQEAQAKLDELLLKFTDQHPDVIAARATLDELKTRRATEMERLRRREQPGVPEHPARAQQGRRRDCRTPARGGTASDHRRRNAAASE